MCFTNIFYIIRQRNVLSSFYIYNKLFCRVQNRRPKYKQVCIGRYIMGLCCRYVHVSLTSTRRYELTTRQRWRQRSPGKSGLIPRKVYCTAMRIYDILLTAIRLIVRTWICLDPVHITKPCEILNSSANVLLLLLLSENTLFYIMPPSIGATYN